YGQRFHDGEAIATGFVESTVHEVVSKRFCKKQQMQWSKSGAHLLLQTRVKTLDGELGAIFKRWYPDMDIEGEEMPAGHNPQHLPALKENPHAYRNIWEWIGGRVSLALIDFVNPLGFTGYTEGKQRRCYISYDSRRGATIRLERCGYDVAAEPAGGAQSDQGGRCAVRHDSGRFTQSAGRSEREHPCRGKTHRGTCCTARFVG